MSEYLNLAAHPARTFFVGVLLAAFLALVLMPATAGAQTPDASVSGTYTGVQFGDYSPPSGERFVLTLEQEGVLLSGTLSAGEAGDTIRRRISGAIVDTTLHFVTHDGPQELWFGTIDAGQLDGRWVSTSPWMELAGSWTANETPDRTRLHFDFGVMPETIPAGEVTPSVIYRLTVQNIGPSGAENVRLHVDRFPAFFRLREVTVARTGSTPVVVPVEDPHVLDLGLRSLKENETVVVYATGTAIPQAVGSVTTIARVSAENAQSVSTRVNLIVDPSAPDLSSSFAPFAIQEESTDHVTYTIQISGPALATGKVIVHDREIGRVLRDARILVHGGISRGTLAEGLQILALDTSSRLVEIIVTGNAAHLLPGQYPTMVTATTNGTQVVRATATLVVVHRPDCVEADPIPSPTPRRIRAIEPENDCSQLRPVDSDSGPQRLRPVDSDSGPQRLRPVDSDSGPQRLRPVDSDSGSQRLRPVDSDSGSQQLRPVDSIIRELIVRIGAENPTWGVRRIAAELAVLGYPVSVETVQRLRPVDSDSGPRRLH